MRDSIGGKIKVFIQLIVSITLLAVFLNAPEISAKEQEEPKVLVIYTTTDGEIDEYQRSFNMLISHFTNDVTFVNGNEVEKKDLDSVTHLFYYGQAPGHLPEFFRELFNEYAGIFVAIGYNSDQLGNRFTFAHQTEERSIHQMYLTSNKDMNLEVKGLGIIETQITEETEVLIEGKNKDAESFYPIMTKNQNNYYLALDTISLESSVLIGEVLHNIFQLDHSATHPGYIRLEDVHPLVNPKPLREIAGVLKEKNIPYMVAVIPIYTDPESGERYTFADSPELLKVLKQMQKDGGSIVQHGYTHQFRSSETGEGFEFWDVEYNTPIYAPGDKPFKLKKEEEFSSKKEYDSYMKDLEKFEKEYTEEKIASGMQELVKFGLYPLAFEAPHYTMSQNGYQILSEHFSTYVGQVQLSDSDWEKMDTTPYATSPTFFNGMQLLPETMGYVRPNDPNAIERMMNKAEMISMTRDGMFAAFYHPYLGVEGFKELIAKMEKLLNISWIDLKQMNQWAKVDGISIHTENGEVIVEKERGNLLFPSFDVLKYYFYGYINYVLWGLVLIGGAAVLAFMTFTVYLKSRKRQLEG